MGNLIKRNLIVLTVVVSIVSLFSSTFQVIELNSLDLRFKVRDWLGLNPVYNASISHVNIDSFSKTESKSSLLPKSYYADVINKISDRGAGVIACDIMFVDWADSTDNKILIQSIINSGNVVSPILFELDANKNEHFYVPDEFGLELFPDMDGDKFLSVRQIISQPISQIMEQSAGIGFVNLIPDPDGILRRIPLISKLNGKLIPSFFLQSVCTYLEYDLDKVLPVNQFEVILKDFIEKSDGTMKDITIPLDGNGNLLVNLSGKFALQQYPGYSAGDIISSKGVPDFSDRLVIFSDISPQGNDWSPTALENLFPRSYFMSSAMSNVLENDLLRLFGIKFSIIIIILMSVLMTISCQRYQLNAFTMFGSLLVLGYIIFSHIFFIFSNLVFPVVPVIVPVGSVFLCSWLGKYIDNEKYRAVIESSLESYLSPVLMEKIKENQDLLKIGGERKRITVLFSDIVDFTGFSDEADPQEVQEVLEQYFKEMTTIIFREKGIVDKYMGDGILAFFENTGDELTSGLSAVQCAYHMQVKALELNKIYKKQNRFPFSIRVGIATGYAKVGNIGPVEKIDYTIIGSVVNLASRLQGFGNPDDIIVDEETVFFLNDEFTTEPLGEQNLKGFSDPLKLFKVLHNK